MVYCQDVGKICGPDNACGEWKNTDQSFDMFSQSIVMCKIDEAWNEKQLISMEFQL